MLDDQADPTLAVIAHALLNSMAVITGNTRLLLEHDLTPERRRELLQRVESQATHVTGILQDLVRGLPAGTLDLLEALDRERHRERH